MANLPSPSLNESYFLREEKVVFVPGELEIDLIFIIPVLLNFEQQTLKMIILFSFYIVVKIEICIKWKFILIIIPT